MAFVNGYQERTDWLDSDLKAVLDASLEQVDDSHSEVRVAGRSIRYRPRYAFLIVCPPPQ